MRLLVDWWSTQRWDCQKSNLITIGRIPIGRRRNSRSRSLLLCGWTTKLSWMIYLGTLTWGTRRGRTWHSGSSLEYHGISRGVGVLWQIAQTGRAMDKNPKWEVCTIASNCPKPHPYLLFIFFPGYCGRNKWPYTWCMFCG